MSDITQIKVNGVIYDITDARVPQWALNPYMKVQHDIEANWNSQPQLIAQEGAIYVYDDHFIVGSDRVPAIKIGTGRNYLIDLPFITDYIDNIVVNHISDGDLHVRSGEREFWNNKFRCYMGSGGNKQTLIFTKN